MVPQEIYNKENSFAKAEAVKKAAREFNCRDNYINGVLRQYYNPKNKEAIISYFLSEYRKIQSKVSEALTA